MLAISKKAGFGLGLAVLALPGSGVAQETAPAGSGITVTGQQPSAPAEAPVDTAAMTEGPEIKGVITARNGDRLKVTGDDGSSTIVAINDATEIKAAAGLFGGSNKLAPNAVVNGLPVTVKTLQGGGTLVASQIKFRNKDLKTTTMIRNATAQRFEEQAAATESLRGRLGDIDKYNIKGTTNVYFDTGKAVLSAEDKASLCATATAAQAQENALILVVGYTDSVGSEDYNQQLSEKRASRVINYLQQSCGWKPYRMLTPTGMAEADPAASNDTAEGKARNRRVAVNILVSKSVDTM